MSQGADIASPFGRGDALLGLSAAALAAVPLVVWLGREPAPRGVALTAIALLVPVLGVLAWMARRGIDRPWTRAILLISAAACVAPIGWFFGPNAGVAAAIALVALLAGLLSRSGAEARSGPERGSSVAILIVLAGGQAVVLGLVLARTLPDASLAPVLVPGHPDWQHAAAHGAAQVVYVGAFLAGRALRERYGGVRVALEGSMRAVALQGALLEEARADYRRALRTARIEPTQRADPTLTSTPGRDLGERPLAPTAGTTAPRAPLDLSTVIRAAGAGDGGTGVTRLWMDAYVRRMRLQHAAVLGLCLFGSAILAVIGRNRVPLVVGLVGMTVIAGLVILQREIARRRQDETSYWPWTLVGALSVAPAYAFGLHSAFACVIAALLFAGGAFRATPGSERVGRRLPVYFAVALTHASVFGLVWAGLVPDDGNQPILSAEQAPIEPLALHLLLQLTYAAAFVGGWAIDSRLQIALREAATAEAAVRASSDVLRRTADEIARVLEETGRGLFSEQTVGRYAVGRLIASGSQGDVYEATRADGSRVALKLVRWDRVGERVAIDLLAQEARALSRVSSPAVARIFEAGVDRDLPYVAMELIEGASLAEVLRERGRLEPDELRVLVRDLCRGIRDVHDAGVVHRDIKPHNLVRVRDAGEGDATWKIVDFGLAQQALGTEPGALGGTPAYVAPEQALGERVDPRADLYSACLVVYRALAGRPAYVGHDAHEIAHRARRLGPPDPRAFVEVSRPVELVLRIGLAADPRDRFATARELGSALTAALDGVITDAHRARGEALLSRAPWAAAG